MAREEAENVSKGWYFKERHHVQTDGTRTDRKCEQRGRYFKERHHVHTDGKRKGGNREQGAMLQRTTSRTN